MYILINVSFCSESDTENIKNDQEQDYQTIMNILLQNPEELDLKHKPSAIRDDNMFTLDRRTVSIESAKADDNGAYISKGRPKKPTGTVRMEQVQHIRMRMGCGM